MKALLASLFFIPLIGCTSLIQYIPEAVPNETMERLKDYCDSVGTDLEGRKKSLDWLNSHADNPTDPHFTAQDCDGDYQPDFDATPNP